MIFVNDLDLFIISSSLRQQNRVISSIHQLNLHLPPYFEIRGCRSMNLVDFELNSHLCFENRVIKANDQFKFDLLQSLPQSLF